MLDATKTSSIPTRSSTGGLIRGAGGSIRRAAGHAGTRVAGAAGAVANAAENFKAKVRAFVFTVAAVTVIR